MLRDFALISFNKPDVRKTLKSCNSCWYFAIQLPTTLRKSQLCQQPCLQLTFPGKLSQGEQSTGEEFVIFYLFIIINEKLNARTNFKLFSCYHASTLNDRAFCNFCASTKRLALVTICRQGIYLF